MGLRQGAVPPGKQRVAGRRFYRWLVLTGHFPLAGDVAFVVQDANGKASTTAWPSPSKMIARELVVP